MGLSRFWLNSLKDFSEKNLHFFSSYFPEPQQTQNDKSPVFAKIVLANYLTDFLKIG